MKIKIYFNFKNFSIFFIYFFIQQIILKIKCQLCIYYYVENNIKVCKNNAKECLDENYAYIKGKECLKQCEPNDYKILSYKDDLNISIEGMNTCFSDYSGCYKKGYRYYNKTNKICTENCDGKKVFNLNNKETIDEGGNCFSNCPSNYPYYDDSIKGCVKKCNSFIDQNECVTDCKSRNKFRLIRSFVLILRRKIHNYYIIYA